MTLKEWVTLQQLAKELGFRRIATARELAKKCAQVPTRRPCRQRDRTARQVLDAAGMVKRG